MKYEIMKGSEKDFEGAPAWAMVILKHINNRRCVFAERKSQGAKRTEMYGDGECVIVSPNEYEIIAERRTITEPVVNQQLTTDWDGTGIAHLGQHVEYFWGEGKEWRKAEVVAHYEEWPLLKDIEDGLMVAELNNKMRPIRSPEDVARDKAIKAMREALGHAAGLIEVRNIYRAIAAGKIPGVKLEVQSAN